MQNLAKKTRKAVEQAELNALKAESYVEALEFEIAVVERKGYIEESFWRFPHIGEQVFEDFGIERKSIELVRHGELFNRVIQSLETYFAKEVEQKWKNREYQFVVIKSLSF